MRYFQRTRKWWALIGIGISAITVALDFTIVNIALPVIQKDLNAKISELQWLIAACGITFCTTLTLLGRLGDLLGRRLMTYIGMAGFLLSSLGAGLSNTVFLLIIFRFIQGLCCAAILPCGMTLVTQAFPEKEQAKAIATYGSFFGIGLALGPIIGGFIISVLNWPWIFFINVPIILISFLISLPSVKETTRQKESIDWLGMILFILSIGSLVFALTEGPTFGWVSTPILSTLFGGLFFLFLFFWVETRTKEPICPLYLFRSRGFWTGTICYVASIACVWPLLFLLPLYLQNILHYSPPVAGLILLAMTGMTVVGSTHSGFILKKRGEKRAILLLFFSIFLGYIFQFFFGWDGPLWLILIAFVIFGWGWGAGNGISTPIALSHMHSKNNEALISGALLTVLNTVAVLLLSIVGVIFRHGQNGGFMRGFHLSILFLFIFTLLLLTLLFRCVRLRKTD